MTLLVFLLPAPSGAPDLVGYVPDDDRGVEDPNVGVGLAPPAVVEDPGSPGLSIGTHKNVGTPTYMPAQNCYYPN